MSLLIRCACLLSLAACGDSIAPSEAGIYDANGRGDTSACGALPAESDHWKGPNGGTVFVVMPLSLPPGTPANDPEIDATLRGPLPPGASPPTARTIGACTLMQWDPTAAPPVSAGTISIGAVTLGMSSPGDYNADVAASPWQPGDAIHIVATGGAFPAFDQTLAMPAGLAVVSPEDPSGGGMLDVSTSAGLTFRWTGGAPCGLVHATVSGAVSAHSGVQIHCLFRATDGVGTVAGELLAGIGPTGAVGLGQATIRSLDLGPDHVDLYVENEAYFAGLTVHP